MDLGAGFVELDLFMADLRGARARAAEFGFNDEQRAENVNLPSFSSFSSRYAFDGTDKNHDENASTDYMIHLIPCCILDNTSSGSPLSRSSSI